MKWCVLFLSCCSLTLNAADLAQVQAVYLLSMRHGMDQYIASRLASGHVFQVVTDPKRADAIFTDRIGAGLEQRLEELFPTPDPEAKPEQKSESKEKESKPAESKEKESTENKSAGSLLDESENKLERPGNMSSFGGGKGTYFLVDLKTRQVLWSTYEKPAASSSEALDRSAGRIVSQLQKALGIKK